jgi:hypothetical protein
MDPILHLNAASLWCRIEYLVPERDIFGLKVR